MGVPRLFKYILDNFPDAIIHFREGKYHANIDYMYLDANGLLHQAAQIVYNYGEMKRKLNPYKNLSEKAKMKKVYQLFFDNIIRVTNVITPTKVLYIAIDGPAPLSKQAQQRQRRFVAAQRRMKEQKTAGYNVFDSNAISPGTIFMHDLTRFMHYAIRKEMNTYPNWKKLKVYFSPATVPGEGEHICMDFIRSLPEEELKNASHCIFGPDGDLIMLTLAAHIPRMFLFREDQYNIGYYHYLDMGNVRGQLAISRSLNDATDDFIVKGFFVGNDFIPKIQMFHLLEEGLEMMNDVYNKTSSNGNFLTVKNRLSLNGFRAFIQKLETYEVEYLEKQSYAKIRDRRFINHTLKNHMSNKKLDYSAYKTSYYKKAFGDFNQKDIQMMCHDYLKSFIWVLNYYVHGLPSWSWAYKYHYAPLMKDFSQYLNDLSDETFAEVATFSVGKASKPFVQLLSILPPPSAKLLPTSYRKLMKPDKKLSKLGYYPSEFKIDYEGKIKEYQGVAILQFVDHSHVESAYSKIKTKSYIRNQLGSVSLFTYDPKFTARFTSDMGNIKQLHVRKKSLLPQRV